MPISADIYQQIRDNVIEIEILDLSDHDITQTEFVYLCAALENNTSIHTLNLEQNHITDITPLAHTTISTVNLSQNYISDITPFANNRKIRTLNLHKNKIRDISMLAVNNVIEWIDLSDNGISEISSLAVNNVIKWIVLSSNNIMSLQDLEGNSSIRIIYLAYNQIEDLTPLTHNVKILWIQLGGNKVKSIEPLVNNKCIQDIRLRNNEIISLEPMARNMTIHSAEFEGNVKISAQDRHKAMIYTQRNAALPLFNFLNNWFILLSNRVFFIDPPKEYLDLPYEEQMAICKNNTGQQYQKELAPINRELTLTDLGHIFHEGALSLGMDVGYWWCYRCLFEPIIANAMHMLTRDESKASLINGEWWLQDYTMLEIVDSTSGIPPENNMICNVSVNAYEMIREHLKTTSKKVIAENPEHEEQQSEVSNIRLAGM